MANDVSYFKLQGDSTVYAFNDADLAEALAAANAAIAAETARAQAAESGEAARAQAAETALGDRITTVSSDVSSVEARVTTLEGTVAGMGKSIADNATAPGVRTDSTQPAAYVGTDGISQTDADGSQVLLQGGAVVATKTLQHQGGFTVPQIQKGTTALVTAPASSYADAVVTFDRELAGNPVVVCGLQGNASSSKYGYLSASVVRSSISTTGCTLRLYNADTAEHANYISWIAVY